MHPDVDLAQELEASAKALRTLARDLVGRDGADDLVQETMLRALDRPPGQSRGLMPWLATVLRNLARNHHRDHRRRRRHELAVAPAPLVPPSDEGIAQHETLRSVTEALWRLPEPYQSTLAQRYFSGLSPKQIARRTDTPLATVKSRLQRGLAMLRLETERRHGPGWRGALVVATGLGLSPAAAAVGIVVMTQSSKVLVGAAVVVIASWWLLSLGAGSAPPPVVAATDGPGVIGGAVAGSGAGLATSEREIAAAPIDGVAIDFAHAFGYQLSCRVIDRDGLIVPRARIAIAPRANAMNAWAEDTDNHGEVTIEWRGKLPEMTIWVGLYLGRDGRRLSQGLQEFRVRSGERSELMLLDSSGGNSGLCGAGVSESLDCRKCHLGTAQPEMFPTQILAYKRMHPESLIADMLLADTGARSPDFAETYESHLDEMSTEAAAKPTGTLITGVVRDRHGEVVGGATVVWSTQSDLAIGRTRSAADGTFRLMVDVAGKLEVRAGGGPHGIARSVLDVTAGQARQCELFLQPERTLRGRLLLPEGVSMAGWRVEYVAHGAGWIDGTDLQPDGTFTLANLPTEAGKLLLWSGHSRLPIAVEPQAVTDGNVTFDLRMRGKPTGRLRVQVLEPDDRHGQHNSIFVFQAETGRGSVMPRTEDGTYELSGLTAGFYRLSLVGAPFGHFDLGEHWVDGQSLVDLGARRVPDAGMLRIPDCNATSNLELYLRRPDIDVYASPVALGQIEFLLPAGDWLMMWGEPDAPSVRSFSIAPNESKTLPLAR